MTDQNLRTISVCWSGGVNALGDALLHRSDEDKACGNQPDTNHGTDLETAAVTDGNELCPACEWPEGSEAVLEGEYIATDGGVDKDDSEGDHYAGAGDGQCLALKNDGARCTNGVYGSDHCCGIHKRAEDVTLAPEQDDRDWFYCNECGWQPADYESGGGSPPFCSWCSVEFGEPLRKWGEDDERAVADGGTEDAEVDRSPEEARIQKLEDRNADLIGAIEEVRDLLEPFDLREMSEQAQDGDGQYEVVIHGTKGIEKEHAELLRKELLHEGYYEDVVSVRKIGGAGDEGDGSHTITCGHCGATNDLDAVKHQGCCHDCRGEIDV